jgi:hypothetical protein
MGENLYQFRTRTGLTVHSGVQLDGPHDKYGYVIAAKDTNDKGTLFMIRGTGMEKKFEVVIKF